MPSRDLYDLHPAVRAKATAHLMACEAHGIDLLVTCTYRSIAEQDALYAQGRTKPGKKVTKAKGGQSFHNYRLAYDVVPLRNGKPVWGTSGEDGKLWQRVGELGEGAGLEWGGRWRGLIDLPHFQYTGGKPLSHFQNGGRLEG